MSTVADCVNWPQDHQHCGEIEGLQLYREHGGCCLLSH